MSFYQELSHYYDEIFHVDQAEMAFIASLFKDTRLLLDIACGTGNKTLYLTAPGRRVIGMDVDSGMIARARETAGTSGISYDVLDMRDMGEKYKGMAFDGIACLGNSLVHLSVQDIGLLIKKAYAMLTKGGLLVIQILNYDRILDQNICTLPDIDTEHVTFTRAYSRTRDGLHFLTSLRLKEQDRVFYNDVILFPLRQSALGGMLAEAGFQPPDWYGSYAGAPMTHDSFVAIAACRK